MPFGKAGPEGQLSLGGTLQQRQIRRGAFRVIFWREFAIPDARLLVNAYPSYEIALAEAERILGSRQGKKDFPLGYTVVLDLRDVM